MGDIIKGHFNKKVPDINSTLAFAIFDEEGKLAKQDLWLITLSIDCVETMMFPHVSIPDLMREISGQFKSLHGAMNAEQKGIFDSAETSMVNACFVLERLLSFYELDKWLNGTSRNNVKLTVTIRVEPPESKTDRTITTAVTITDKENETLIIRSSNQYIWNLPRGNIDGTLNFNPDY